MGPHELNQKSQRQPQSLQLDEYPVDTAEWHAWQTPAQFWQRVHKDFYELKSFSADHHR